MTKFALNQLNKMKENKEYQKEFENYLNCKSNGYHEKAKESSKALKKYQQQYSLSEYQFHRFIKVQQQRYKKNIDSNTAQKIATQAWQAVESVLYRKGKKLHLKKYNTLSSLEGKTNKQGIRFNKEEQRLLWNKLSIWVKIRKSDMFLIESLDKKIKYCRIVRKPFKQGYKFFLQLVMEGIPPTKYCATTGEVRHINRVDSSVGLDIGTSSLAYCSEHGVGLVEIAPNSTKYDKQIVRCLKSLERSRKAMNPDNYNENGTVKKGQYVIKENGKKRKVKLRWKHSKKYKRKVFELKNLYRLKAIHIKSEHCKLANIILSLGDEIYVETMNFKGLEKKAKETTVNEKTGKFNSKKRYGKSLGNKAPAMLITIIEQKLSYQGKTIKKVNTQTFKASQYHHVDDVHIKKELKQRWNVIDGKNIQRDLYSAFLLMNSKATLKETDKEACNKNFEQFVQQHDECIVSLRNQKHKLLSSFGL